VATIVDVAAKAKVSVGSVSRVFRGHANVEPATVEAVLKAAKALGYEHPTRRRPTPHGLQVQLRRVALVTLGMAQSLSRLPVVASLLEGASQELTERGIVTVVADAPDLSVIPPALASNQVDGVIVKAGLQGDPSHWRAPAVEAATAFPHVWLEGRPAGVGGDMVGSDSWAVGRIAAERLVERGHRRLAFLSPKSDQRLFLERQASFEWHARRLGADVVAAMGDSKGGAFPVQAPQELKEVAFLLGRLLSGRSRPSALFVPADSIAVLAYRALQERGLKPGKDLAILSCNHETALVEGLHPSLTTVDIHAREIGARAVDQLYWRAGRPGNSLRVTVSVAPRLIEGDSA
jgi:LacI family transcriptional regulator